MFRLAVKSWIKAIVFTYLHIVFLADKKQQWSSKNFKEAYEKEGYCRVAQAGLGTTATSEQKAAKAPGLTIFHINGFDG